MTTELIRVGKRLGADVEGYEEAVGHATAMRAAMSSWPRDERHETTRAVVERIWAGEARRRWAAVLADAQGVAEALGPAR